MTYTRLRYHLITATRHRAPTITAEVAPLLYRCLQSLAQKRGGVLLAIGGVEDHVHLVAAIPPTIAVSHFIGVLKAGSARAVNHHRSLNPPLVWQRGYGALSLRAFDYAQVIAYVNRQRAHHAHNRLIPHLEITREPST